MYQKIYDVVEKRGRVKTGIFLNGEETGLKYLVEEDCFFLSRWKKGERNSRRITEKNSGRRGGDRRCESGKSGNFRGNL